MLGFMKASLKNTHHLHLSFIILAFVVTRLAFLLSPSGQTVDCDEAVFGLMAQKIEALEDFPIYMWNNHYAGAAISYLSAVIFHFFDSGPVQLRLAGLFSAIFSMVFFYQVYRRLFGKTAALFSSLFLVFCPFLVLHYTIRTYGTYGETFLGISVLILLSHKIEENQNLFGSPDAVATFLGFLSGFFFYICYLVLPAVFAFAVPAVWSLSHKRSRTVAFFIAGGIIGAFPFILYNLNTGGWSFLRAASWSLATGRDQIHLAMPDLLKQILINKTIYMKTWFVDSPVMFGSFVLPDSFGSFVISSAGYVLIAVLAVFVFSALSKRISVSIHQRRWVYFLLFLISFQWIAGLYRPRHLLPLIIIIPVVLLSLAGSNVRKQYAVLMILILLSIGQVLNWPRHFGAAAFDPRPVIDVMEKNSIKTFYGTYHSVYPIMFMSKGELVGSPRLLRPGTHYFDPMPQSTSHVRNSSTAAFVFLNVEKDIHDSCRNFLKDHEISFKNITEVDFTVYFDLSKPVDIALDSGCSTRFTLKKDLMSMRQRGYNGHE
jgi:4-amino-4-deoxy-L-arabinose transferase-like glycosyltransferase